MTEGLHLIEQLPPTVEGAGFLGRHVHHDPRSWQYPAEMAAKIQTVMHKRRGPVFDQGDLGSCTANAALGMLMTDPFFDGQTYTEDDAVALYEMETLLDDVHGHYPPDDTGSTGIGLGRALKREGKIKYYRHAFGLDHALRALTLRPVCFGIEWLEGFDELQSDGEARPAGDVRGGHEIVADGLDVEDRRVWFTNSWGDWGPLNGRFYMTWDTVDMLLNQQGDVMTAGLIA